MGIAKGINIENVQIRWREEDVLDKLEFVSRIYDFGEIDLRK